jgi:citrate synthase
MSSTEIYSPGLEGVIAGETAISTLAGGLSYRGYPVSELVQVCEFEEVAYLLLYGELPTNSQLDAFKQRLVDASPLPGHAADFLEHVPPGTPPMDLVRSAVSLLAHDDADAQSSDTESNLRKSERLLAQIPTVLGHIAAVRDGLTAKPMPELGIAGNLLWLVTGIAPDAEARKAFDVSLILYAEHEFNASTFAARVVTSTGSDMHSSIVAAIGALKGALHGGANEKVMDVIKAAGAPSNAAAWLEGALVRKEKIMGFGHRVYKTGDVRAKILREFAKTALERAGMSHVEETAAILEDGMAKAKQLYPNLDWPAGWLYHALGLDTAYYTPFFVASRVTGWCAHVMEQQAHNRIIRPKSRYNGPEIRPVPPIGKR